MWRLYYERQRGERKLQLSPCASCGIVPSMRIAILLAEAYLVLALGSLFVFLLWARNEEAGRKRGDSFAAADTGTEAGEPEGKVSGKVPPTPNIGSSDDEPMDEPSGVARALHLSR